GDLLFANRNRLQLGLVGAHQLVQALLLFLVLGDLGFNALELRENDRVGGIDRHENLFLFRWRRGNRRSGCRRNLYRGCLYGGLFLGFPVGDLLPEFLDLGIFIRIPGQQYGQTRFVVVQAAARGGGSRGWRLGPLVRIRRLGI